MQCYIFVKLDEKPPYITLLSLWKDIFVSSQLQLSRNKLSMSTYSRIVPMVAIATLDSS